MNNYIPMTGDVVRVVRNDNKVYDCFVVESVKHDNLFYGRVLESSKDKVATTDWDRYGLKGNCICQVRDETKSVELLTKSDDAVMEDMSHTVIYRNRIPGTNRKLTLCLSEGFGGWSDEEDEDPAILESYGRALRSRTEVRENG